MVCAAAAQQRPHVTEDPEPVGAGRILIESGFDYARDAEWRREVTSMVPEPGGEARTGTRTHETGDTLPVHTRVRELP